MKRLFLCLLICGMVLFPAGCAKTQARETETLTETAAPSAYGQPTVGICLPAQEARWEENAALLADALGARSYAAQIRYADNQSQTQAQQIAQLVKSRVCCLIITPVDATVLTGVLAQAKAAGIPVIAYERLLTDTEHVDALVSFDYRAIGAQIGQAIAAENRLESAAQESRRHTVEFFNGPADDHSALLIWEGIAGELTAYLDEGTLTCPSGRVSFEDTVVLHWDEALAREKCGDILTKHYADAAPDIVCAASDSLAAGVLTALTERGIPGGDVTLTGQGGAADALRRVRDGVQTMTVYKDDVPLAKLCARVAASLIEGKPEQAGTVTDNHAAAVPSFFLQAQTVDAGNWDTIPD